MLEPTKQTLISALNQPDFEDWQPQYDVDEFDRPRNRPAHLGGEGRFAAVLILVYPSTNGKLDFVLTRRRNDLPEHPGQISLPGGRVESGETYLQAALRETEEELGVNRSTIESLGALHSVYIPPSDFTVFPFVGWCETTPRFVAEEKEVAEIVEVPLTLLLSPEIFVYGPMVHDGEEIVGPYFLMRSHQVWGATAVMLTELVDRIRSVEGMGRNPES